jgi:hybrid cluster-associated redox disulfide protein
MPVDEIMRIWPQTISVFIENRMECIGCPLATFHTIVDAAREHEIDLDRLLEEFFNVINS